MQKEEEVVARLRVIAFLAVAVGAFIAVAPASAVPVGTLDYSCTPSGQLGFGLLQSPHTTAQKFTAGATGKVRYVEVDRVARAAGGTGGQINVELLGVDGSGVPVGPALATTAIPGAQITADNVARTLSATFDPATAYRVIAGTSYAIALNTADTAQNSWEVGNNTCPGAAHFSFSGGPYNTGGFASGEDAGLDVYLGPPNDDFGHAQTLTGSTASIGGTTLGASGESGDDFVTEDQSSIGRSVWYRWTAPGSGPTTVDTCTTNYDSLLAVFAGSGLGALTPVATNNNNPDCLAGYGSKVSFDAVQGTTYHIDVDGCCGAPEGTFTLALSGPSAPPPPIVTTPPATPITGQPVKRCKKRPKSARPKSARLAKKCKRKKKKK